MKWHQYGFNAWYEYDYREQENGYSLTGSWAHETGLTLGFHALLQKKLPRVKLEWDAEETAGLRGYAYYEHSEWPWDWLVRAPSFKHVDPLQLALDLDVARSQTMEKAARAVQRLALVDLGADSNVTMRELESFAEGLAS